ncbi:MAG: hypothetical protein L0196_08575 [candidate division Zixibacteria bacterium]|nr:hypothetical protein [candidate division Zixibacteria bacterium]
MPKLKLIYLAGLLLLALSSGCGENDAAVKPRLVMFVGMDISGSFMKTREENFDDGMEFLSHYLYAHLNGLGGLDKPSVLFVSSIGGAKPEEPKTFFPIQTFDGKSVDEIHDKLVEIFPKEKPNDFTDFNAFFEQIALTVRNKNLVLRPISIVLVSDGIPDAKLKGKTDFRSLELKPLERLARNITVRVLYTDAVVGRSWQTKVRRSRVKIWTQDALVMTTWKDPKILQPEKTLEEQTKFFGWVQDNVDFGVRARRVD